MLSFMERMDIKMNMKNNNNMKNKFRIFILLHFSIMIYTLSGIVSKFTSYEELFSFKFVMLYGLEVIILGIYAVLWQQVISRMELSVAYSNKSVTLIWSLIWGTIIFKENFTISNIIGIIVVIIGIMLINSDSPEKEDCNE